MRRYVFGTGIIGAITSGMTLLRALREQEPFTWRTALAWLGWAITLALAIGAIVDTRRAGSGRLAPADSPVAGHEGRLLRQGIEH